VDLNCITPPVVPQPGQRVVGIDPGRRDMITAVAEENEVIKVSTKQHIFESGRNKMQRHTNRLLHKAGLIQSLRNLAAHRVSSMAEWIRYLNESSILLDKWMSVHRSKSILRQHFQHYIKKDKSLDRICKRICGKNASMPTLIAFGAASTCGSGFGYTTAPQKRLRMRLSVIHGARVTLIGEYYTSQKCCLCQAQMNPIFKRYDHGSPIIINGARTSIKIHGVMRCTSCGVCHRDVNAAKNIRNVYLHIAQHGIRPLPFTHV
jgi:hypothetical protein